MKVEGVSEAWLKHYGAKILEKIDTFCKEKGESVKRDTFPVQHSQSQPQEELVKVNLHGHPIEIDSRTCQSIKTTMHAQY